MLDALLTLFIALAPIALIIFFVYRVAGKKVGIITSLVVGAILLVALAFTLTGPPSSNPKNAATAAGEKAISQVVREDHPGAHYSVTGRVVTRAGQTVAEYIVRITGEYNAVAYAKFNKEACTRLGDNNANLITTFSRGILSPVQGKGDTCQYWLSLK